MNEELQQEFRTVSVKHLLFKSKLRSFLYGANIDEEPIRSPEICAFGQWIHNEALIKYSHLPESRQLDRVHREIHRVANRLMDLRLQGQTEQAIDGLLEVDALADQLTDLLRLMQQKLAQA
ncbi:CZB domain-containing protein [Hymenobacter sp. BT491]|uniref:CZB domain-containing protein n=1 Tax=Hymenobacter sp. BT491 TaxID=2766779 RepID=UPI0016534D67|nr:CZB domain-containing protein [Hymenobacter sp. BT491]MBC6990491.1 CZB domain-containing protein [Hymenobacter sp. BT491]